MALFVGRFNYIFIHYAVAFLHEFFHLLAAKLTRTEVESFVFLPFGFYAKMSGLERQRPLVQLFVVAMGPLSVIPALIFLNLLHRGGALSVYAYSYGVKAAVTVCLFNLIPLYPLDGARLLEIVAARFCDEYRTRQIRIGLAVMSFIGLTVLCFYERQFLVWAFLTVSTVLEIALFRRKYLQFLLRRLFDETKRPLRIVKKARVFRYRDTRLFDGEKLLDEKETIRLTLAESRRSRRR